MFDGYSLKNCLPSNTVLIKKPLNSNEHHYSIGREQWQQTYTTVARMSYTEKDLRNNHIELNKPYLFPNHSNFEIGMFTNTKGLYQTSNKNDFHPVGMTLEEKEKFQKNFLKEKTDLKGIDDNAKNETIYQLMMQNPKLQKKEFDYDSIKFKYNDKITDTITQEEKKKDPNACWGFDYYNREKNKGIRDIELTSGSTNAALDKKRRKKKYKGKVKQVWDPIANRFFECPDN